MSFDRPKEPGVLSDDALRYTIQHRSKYYAPWQIEAEPATWRDIWAIIRKRYRPKLKLSIRLSLEGTSRILKDTWTGSKLMEQFSADSPLLRVPIVKKDEAS